MLVRGSDDARRARGAAVGVSQGDKEQQGLLRPVAGRDQAAAVHQLERRP